MLRHRADHVQPRRLRRMRDSFRRGPLPLGDIQLRTLHLGVAVIIPPRPHRHRQPDRVFLRGHAHILARTAPSQRAHIGVGQPVGLQRRLFGRLNLRHRKRQRHIQQLARFAQPLGMFHRFEDLAVIATLTLKHRGRVMQGVGQDMYVRRTPFHQLAIHPDEPVAVVIPSHHHLPFLRMLRKIGPNRTQYCAKSSLR
ncbi:MAG: hypothetical protein ACD_54C01274G0001 [uncultured bacterium]|nr:MAG: hypothetical protein ACD_54C01274G0001 [uncultured bacterium]